MADKHPLEQYKKWYSILLRLYPKPFRDRFAVEMQQTFDDLCNEQRNPQKEVFHFFIWIFFDTFLEIIKEHLTFFTMTNKSLIRVATFTLTILAIPFIAMQFTTEVQWGLLDFLIIGLLLFGAGSAYELIAQRVNNVLYKTAVAITVLTGLLLIWVNLAVGIIGDEGNPANLMYLGVLAVVLGGAFLVYFEPRRMAYVLYTAAAAQMLVAFIARIPLLDPVFVLNGAFAFMWLVSALFFRHAGVSVRKNVAA